MKHGKLWLFLFGTLRGRLILGVALVHALMMTVFISDLTLKQRVMLLNSQEENAKAISQTLATSAAGWLASNDVAGLQELVDSQRQNPELIFAMLADHQGRILAHTDRSKKGQLLLDLPGESRLTLVSKRALLVDVIAPVMIGNTHVGWSRVGMGQKRAAQELADIGYNGVLYAFVAIFLGTIIAWQLGRRITRRLYSVQETINQINAGDRLARCLTAGTDEAALLAHEFNGMLEVLGQREQELQQKNAELERFTYTVSHDLKSPLITIKGFAGSLEKDLLRGNYGRMAEDLKRVSDAADKMTELLRDLLELSTIGRIIKTPEPVDMNLLAADVLEQLAGSLHNHNLTVAVQPNLPTVFCDRQRMAEVLQNLLENAINYMGDQAEPHIQFGMREKNGETVFFVQDNGIGIDEKYHKIIFGLFNKLDANSGGTGIGLALVKRIIEVHGGKVWVESDGEGAGSRFCFTVGL